MSFIGVHEFEGPLSNLLFLNSTFQSINKILETKNGLSIVQWSFLRTLLERPAIAPQALAKALGVTPGTLSQTTLRLEKKKYIFVCEDPKDARKKMISLTRLGKDALEKSLVKYENIFSNIANADVEIKTIADFLNRTKKQVLEIE